ncbi:ferritin family protein [uncultured Desulfuromonas sp.]|uniref:ferritin family protein n=1 Tax=uncultured Desulfuromonas sp. TaxID=181013 RepID=UPI00261336AC|nr:ferritin family protein [uncultured Desulfuromonas sp.]
MPQELKLQEAIKLAIQSKKNLVDFYREAAQITENLAGRAVFSNLSEEVRENVKRFFHLYRGAELGTFEDFMAIPPNPDTAMLTELRKSLNESVHERRAREIALREEEDLEKNLRSIASRVVDPSARSVLEKAADETRNHAMMIESEYARTMAMVHETDVATYVRE